MHKYKNLYPYGKNISFPCMHKEENWQQFKIYLTDLQLIPHISKNLQHPKNQIRPPQTSTRIIEYNLYANPNSSAVNSNEVNPNNNFYRAAKAVQGYQPK